MITEETLKKLTDPIVSLAHGGYHIILCGTRTDGKTVNTVDGIANLYNYHTLWKSSYYTPSLNTDVVNRFAARVIVDLINSIIAGQL